MIGIEKTDTSEDVKTYRHRKNALYLLGAEDSGIPKNALEICQDVIHINSKSCLNVSCAGSVIMYDRLAKGEANECEY